MPRPNSAQPKARMTMAFTRAVRDRIYRLQHLTEAESATEVIRRALAIYESIAGLEGELYVKRGESLVRILLIP